MTTTPDPPVEAWRLLNGFRIYQLMVIACRLGLPDLVAKKPSTAAELAAATGVDADSLRRMLRGLVVNRFFTEDADRRFHATEVSDFFRSDRPGLRNITVMLSREGYATWAEAFEAIRTGAPVFERVHGRGRWEKMAESPPDAFDFNAAMVSGTTRVANKFVPAIDFTGVREVVDVGGGNGALLSAVLKEHREIKGVLFDLPAGLAGARDRLRAEGVAERVEIVEGSFFDSVPAGADLYLLKSIVHDWDEPRALAILNSCRAAMTAPGARLLLVERTLPDVIEDPDVALPTVMSDLHMLVVLGGRERTPGEYGELLSRARLRMTRHIAFDSEFGAVEAVVA